MQSDVSLEYIRDAEVSLLKNGNFLSRLTYADEGNYTASTKIETSESYQLKVDHPKYPKVSASCITPEKPQIKGMDTMSIKNEWGYSDMRVDLTFADPKDATNYYALKIVARYSYYDEYEDTTYSHFTYPYLEKGIAMPGESSRNNGALIFEDAMFNGKDFTYTFLTEPNLNRNDWWEVRLFSLEQDLYRYLVSRSKSLQAENNPLAEPVQVYSNIRNGMGIFAGAAGSVLHIKGNSEE